MTHGNQLHQGREVRPKEDGQHPRGRTFYPSASDTHMTNKGIPPRPRLP